LPVFPDCDDEGFQGGNTMPSIKGVLARVAGTITNVRTNANVVALTFDDGPHPEYTPRLLDILNRHGAKGTFFVVGTQAQKHPEIIERMVADGHALGCHSWDHTSFPAISRKERHSQIHRWESAVQPHRTRLFRPPFGHQSMASYRDVRLCGYHPITWSRVVVDWLDHDSAQLSQRLMEVIRPGEIILMHDNLYHHIEKKFGDRTPTLMTVETILKNMAQTYRFVTVPELFHHGRIHRKWYWQPPDNAFLAKLQVSE
jgi:peptidoglycan/xylan/chitin deacetylase (PgdA/CDA1 family)